MRADVGSVYIRGRGAFRDQFLDNTTWPIVHRRALENVGSADGEGELVNCEIPRVKRIDFCFWSATAAPLLYAPRCAIERWFAAGLCCSACVADPSSIPICRARRRDTLQALRGELSGDAARLGSRVRARFATRVVREAFEGETRGRPWKAEATRTSTAMATTAPPAMSVRKMLPNSVGPSSSSLS